MLSKANTSNTKNIFDSENELKPIRVRTDDNISNIFRKFFKKKFIFNSAFDHKGSKQFLNSKKLALKHIIIDEDNSSSNDTQNEKNHPQTAIFQTIKDRAKSTNDIFLLEHNHLKNKANELSNDKNKNNHKKQYYKSVVTKELNIKKIIKKFLSLEELKMFKDKNINKIKPIKKLEFIKENNKKFYPFVETDNSNSIDSSIINLVSQIK